MSRTPVPTRLAYPVADAAELLGVGRTYVYELMGRGELRSFTVGRRRLVAHDDLVAFIDAQRTKAAT